MEGITGWVGVGKGEIGNGVQMFVSAYGTGIDYSEGSIQQFWNDLSECVRSLQICGCACRIIVGIVKCQAFMKVV